MLIKVGLSIETFFRFLCRLFVLFALIFIFIQVGREYGVDVYVGVGIAAFNGTQIVHDQLSLVSLVIFQLFTEYWVEESDGSFSTALAC